MRGFLVLCFVAALWCVADAQTCPANGIQCYPECSTSYRQCSGTTFYPVQQTPSGTVCSNGQMVYPYQCTASGTTTAPATTTTQKPASTTQKPASTSSPTTTTTQKPATTSAPTGSCSLSQIFTQADWNTLFPNANVAANRGDKGQFAIFTYQNLINAAASFPAFGCTGNDATRKKELAAFLAQTSQETSGWWSGQPYNWGYVFSTEACATSGNCDRYCDASNTVYPCATGKSYYGRGPIQLSWNYNYGQVSQALFGDKSLVSNPDAVTSDGVIAFKTAFWFWMTTQSPKPSCHDVITGLWTPSSADLAAGRVAGFGMLTNIINGGIECGYLSQQSQNRAGYFNAYAGYYGVSDANLYCDKMQHY